MTTPYNNDQIPPIRYIIIGFIVLSIVMALVVAVYFQVTNNSPTQAPESYTDTSSGQTIISQGQRSPETANSNAVSPVFIGFAELVTVGFATDHIQAVKAHLTEFAAKSNMKSPTISLEKSSITQRLGTENSDTTYTFTVVVDNKAKYIATASLPTISDVEITLYSDSSKPPVYTSIQDE